MGDKSIQKKNYIIKKAREVFARKGYQSVTMKDIVEACQISRGGLYLYYDSVYTLFKDVLDWELLEDAGKVMEEETKNYTSAQWIMLFFREQKKEILDGKNNLSIAMYEFYFHNEYPENEHPLNIQFKKAVHVLEILIKRAVREGDFVCEDPTGTARNMMYAMEGLRIQNCSRHVTEKEIDMEIEFLVSPLRRDNS